MPLTVEEIVDLVHQIYLALEGKRITSMLNALLDNAALRWGPFTFEGKEEIDGWARTLLDLFTSIHIIDRAITVDEGRVRHEFLLEVVTLDAKKGIMPISGNYTLKGHRFQRIDLIPRDSFLFLDSGLYNALKF